MVTELTIAKDFMEDAVQNRKMFRDFLQTVVESEEARSRYKDIRELIRRCETLGRFCFYRIIFYTEILTRKVVLCCFFTSETSEKIHNSTFRSQNLSIERNFFK